jgi:hypothetical protein
MLVIFYFLSDKLFSLLIAGRTEWNENVHDVYKPRLGMVVGGRLVPYFKDKFRIF